MGRSQIAVDRLPHQRMNEGVVRPGGAHDAGIDGEVGGGRDRRDRLVQDGGQHGDVHLVAEHGGDVEESRYLGGVRPEQGIPQELVLADPGVNEAGLPRVRVLKTSGITTPACCLRRTSRRIQRTLHVRRHTVRTTRPFAAPRAR
jgi:hypothetical protein